MVWWTYLSCVGLTILVTALVTRRVWRTAVTGVGALVGFGFLFLILSAFVPSNYDKDCWNTKLVALGSNSVTGGHFFLGSGTLQDTPTYEFFWDDGTGRIYEGHVAADGKDGPVSIVEEQREDGYLKICPPTNSGWTRWIAFFTRNQGRYQSYEFHVPKGSVRRGFDVGVG